MLCQLLFKPCLQLQDLLGVASDGSWETLYRVPKKEAEKIPNPQLLCQDARPAVCVDGPGPDQPDGSPHSDGKL